MAKSKMHSGAAGAEKRNLIMSNARRTSWCATWLLAALCSVSALSGNAALIGSDQKAPSADLTGGPASDMRLLDANPAGDPSAALDSALRLGVWRKACSIATNVLARQERNVDALGVFGLCAAVRNDKEAAGKALQRLREAEGAPNYYATMTQGILRLRGGSASEADAMFKSVLKARPDDPLALYFTGEAMHARNRDGDAVSSFKAVLKRWPDHAPALASAAKLMASPKASKEDLREAVSLTERATKIEPMNLAYWKQMADLYERVGERDRAAAVRLQWLSPPSVK